MIRSGDSKLTLVTCKPPREHRGPQALFGVKKGQPLLPGRSLLIGA